jgi:hypothetical protein
MRRVQFYIAGSSAGAPDTGNKGGFINIQPGFSQTSHQRAENHPQSATGTPDMGQALHTEEFI